MAFTPIQTYQNDVNISALARIVANDGDTALNIIKGASVSAALATGSASWVDRAVVRINMPDPRTLTALGISMNGYRGLLDHEAGHARFSFAPSSSMNSSHGKKVRTALAQIPGLPNNAPYLITGAFYAHALNVIEDHRMEYWLARAMPGTARHLDALNRDAVEVFGKNREILGQDVSINHLIWWASAYANCLQPRPAMHRGRLDRLFCQINPDPRALAAVVKLAAVILQALPVKNTKRIHPNVDALLIAAVVEANALGMSAPPEPEPEDEPQDDDGEPTDGQDEPDGPGPGGNGAGTDGGPDAPAPVRERGMAADANAADTPADALARLLNHAPWPNVEVPDESTKEFLTRSNVLKLMNRPGRVQIMKGWPE